ncbi:flagellar export chaperone FlgN [Roseateles aquatilis]|nr:flagellar export chaperone FlgN [Roseateles aquatilis]
MPGHARRRGDSAAVLALQQLRDGLARDLRDYGTLREWLERQFHAALHHDAEAIADLSARILAQATAIEAQHVARRELLAALLGPNTAPTLRALVARLPTATAEPLAALHREFERAMTECHALNLRNAQLITEQQMLMQQLLGREEHVYAER